MHVDKKIDAFINSLTYGMLLSNWFSRACTARAVHAGSIYVYTTISVVWSIVQYMRAKEAASLGKKISQPQNFRRIAVPQLNVKFRGDFCPSDVFGEQTSFFLGKYQGFNFVEAPIKIQ